MSHTSMYFLYPFSLVRVIAQLKPISALEITLDNKNIINKIAFAFQSMKILSRCSGIKAEPIGNIKPPDVLIIKRLKSSKEQGYLFLMAN